MSESEDILRGSEEIAAGKCVTGEQLLRELSEEQAMSKTATLAQHEQTLDVLITYPRGLRDTEAASLVAIRDELKRLRAESTKLQAFKDWVHGYLDQKGIPTNPDGPHSKEGCRIGDRMDLVFAERDRLRSGKHASAPKGYKCSDCTIDSEPCPKCYAAWWKRNHPNVQFVDNESWLRERAEKAEGTAAEMRAAVQEYVDVFAGPVKQPIAFRAEAWAGLMDVLETDAGRGWVSPERATALTAVVRQCEEALTTLRHEKTGEPRQKTWGDCLNELDAALAAAKAVTGE